MKNPSFEANLVLSTLSSDADSQTDTTIIGRQEKYVKRRTGNKRVSRRPNKSTSKTENKSSTINKTKDAVSRNTHPCLMEKKNETNQGFLKETTNLPLNVSNINLADSVHENRAGVSAVIQNDRDESHNPSCSRNTTKSNKTPSGKALVNSVFSSITKRKSSNDEKIKEKSPTLGDCDILEEAVPNSPPPPAKKARLIFQKCFQRTFDRSENIAWIRYNFS